MMTYNILIAEDEDIIRTGLCTIIRKLDLPIGEIYEAGTGKQAEELCVSCQPDIILTDIVMPDCTGLELIAKIKSQQLSQAKIVVISGYDEFKYAQNALQLGVSNYLLKPVKRNQLYDALKELIQLINQQRYDLMNAIIGKRQQLMEVVDSDLAREETLYRLSQIGIEDHFDKYVVILAQLNENTQIDICAIKDQVVYRLELGNNRVFFLMGLSGITSEGAIKIWLSQKGNIAYNGMCPPFGDIAQIKTGYRQALDALDTSLPDIDTQIDGVINYALKYINENISQPLDLETMSKKLLINPNYFSHLFKKKTKENFVVYLQKARVEYAKKLLADPLLRIYQIADMVGYNNEKYFFKIFKKYTKYTPSQYRKKVLKN